MELLDLFQNSKKVDIHTFVVTCVWCACSTHVNEHEHALFPPHHVLTEMLKLSQ